MANGNYWMFSSTLRASTLCYSTSLNACAHFIQFASLPLQQSTPKRLNWGSEGNPVLESLGAKKTAFPNVGLEPVYMGTKVAVLNMFVLREYVYLFKIGTLILLASFTSFSPRFCFAVASSTRATFTHLCFLFVVTFFSLLDFRGP